MSTPDQIRTKEAIREDARALGFIACGFTSAAPLDCGSLLSAWIADRRHGRMDYLERDLDRRVDPRGCLPSARSVIVVAYPYPPVPVRDPDWRSRLTGRIAGYALGGDYHHVIGERLAILCEHLHRAGAREARPHVDFGPLVEKDLARRAGIGWYGHNTNVLTRDHGSFLVLGCVLTDLELDPDPPFVESHCGTCRACLPACPTGALDSPPTIDASRCISYLTIELRGPIPTSLRPLMRNWVFGCDDCQTVCPWNPSTELVPSAFLQPSLVELLGHSEESFAAAFGATPLVRAKRRGIARNAAIALGNSGNQRAVGTLESALRKDPEAIVRAHAAWALGCIGGPEARKALAAARASRELPPVVAEIEAATVATSRGRDPHDADL
ncbi:MAG TPA: tRNA epoxyqueuosine(34) reductase QueG [Candidatus Binatia bacterium]|nr:tRNA epoxyqueuosine(34) reductase QueG [Candidatus Binatia bacterium]